MANMDHPLFCLLDVILTLKIDDDIEIPEDKSGIRLRRKEEVFGLPVFRQPTAIGSILQFKD